MHHQSMIFSLFLVFSGAAVIATVALYARQALLVAYIALGVILGPWGLNQVSDPALIADLSNIGIIFLLFLLGLNLEPADLHKLFREALEVVLVSSVVLTGAGFGIAMLFGFSVGDSLLIGACMMFSSTIIALKLLPTSALHHQRMGELIVSILLLQDMLAILLILLLHGLGSDASVWKDTVLVVIGLPALAVGAWLMSRFVIIPLIRRFDRIQEYIFLLAIGWCLGVAELASLVGLSHEVGAFIAGVTLATNPIARFIAESLKPLRDFFLILFFFALGAGFDFADFGGALLPAMVLTALALVFKPWVFRLLLKMERERASMAAETGMRLGQISEFSLLIVLLAGQLSLISDRASALVQTSAILSFIASSYWIVMRYPTPIAVDEKLRRD